MTYQQSSTRPPLRKWVHPFDVRCTYCGSKPNHPCGSLSGDTNYGFGLMADAFVHDARKHTAANARRANRLRHITTTIRKAS